jgi:polyisoprenoid-binding protein YceI
MNVQRTLLAAFLTTLAAVPVRAETRVLALDPAASQVSFTLGATGHDVRGALALKSGRIAFDPVTGAASGTITVDLASAATGNESRDDTMREKVLETAAHPLAVFKAERLRGAVAPSGSSQVTLDGTLSFHGADHKMSLPAKVQVNGGRLEAEVGFPVPFVEWGLHDPSIAFLRVEKVVTVKVLAKGTLGTEGAAGSQGER